MTKYIITIQDRYQVEADTPEQALASYRVAFDGHDPELLGLTPTASIDQEAFEYLDGRGSVEEAPNA